MTDRKRFWSYILIAFGGGWLLMAVGMILADRLDGSPGAAAYSVLVAAAMFAPMLGVLVAHGGLKRAKTGVRWKPEIIGRGKWYLLAWFAPAVVSIVCAALFFLLFPARFDGSMPMLQAQLDAAAAAGQEVPFTVPVLAVISLLQTVTYAPFLNMLLAVGEESGWRGFMTPYLMKRFGRTGGMVLAGVVWAMWHWPLILLAGYEYGTGYWGAPFTGMLLMCLFTASLGILLTVLYERAGSIWAPALCHGAVNAAAGIGMIFLRPDITSVFLGPTPAGLVAGIPLFALAVWALIKVKAPAEEPEEAKAGPPAEAQYTKPSADLPGPPTEGPAD